MMTGNIRFFEQARRGAVRLPMLRSIMMRS
jgi:hypothetical protein